MADPWLLHTELHLAAVYDCCERTAAKELLRRKCCEGNAEERTAAKKLLRTDCCEGDFCMRLCFTPAENGLLHTELIRSWSGAAHD